MNKKLIGALIITLILVGIVGWYGYTYMEYKHRRHRLHKYVEEEPEWRHVKADILQVELPYHNMTVAGRFFDSLPVMKGRDVKGLIDYLENKMWFDKRIGYHYGGGFLESYAFLLPYEHLVKDPRKNGVYPRVPLPDDDAPVKVYSVETPCGGRVVFLAYMKDGIGYGIIFATVDNLTSFIRCGIRGQILMVDGGLRMDRLWLFANYEKLRDEKLINIRLTTGYWRTYYYDAAMLEMGNGTRFPMDIAIYLEEPVIAINYPFYNGNWSWIVSYPLPGLSYYYWNLIAYPAFNIFFHLYGDNLVISEERFLREMNQSMRLNLTERDIEWMKYEHVYADLDAGLISNLNDHSRWKFISYVNGEPQPPAGYFQYPDGFGFVGKGDCAEEARMMASTASATGWITVPMDVYAYGPHMTSSMLLPYWVDVADINETDYHPEPYGPSDPISRVPVDFDGIVNYRRGNYDPTGFYNWSEMEWMKSWDIVDMISDTASGYWDFYNIEDFGFVPPHYLVLPAADAIYRLVPDSNSTAEEWARTDPYVLLALRSYDGILRAPWEDLMDEYLDGRVYHFKVNYPHGQTGVESVYPPDISSYTYTYEFHPDRLADDDYYPALEHLFALQNLYWWLRSPSPVTYGNATLYEKLYAEVHTTPTMSLLAGRVEASLEQDPASLIDSIATAIDDNLIEQYMENLSKTDPLTENMTPTQLHYYALTRILDDLDHLYDPPLGDPEKAVFTPLEYIVNLYMKAMEKGGILSRDWTPKPPIPVQPMEKIPEPNPADAYPPYMLIDHPTTHQQALQEYEHSTIPVITPSTK